jgi:hypothetical protein
MTDATLDTTGPKPAVRLERRLADPPAVVLSYTWGEDEILRFELYPDGDGTRLLLTDQLQAGWAARNAAGWEECLDRLDVYSAAFEPRIGPQEGMPAEYKGEVSAD